MDGYDPYNFYGMGSASDPFNFFSSTAYSTQFSPTATSPYGDAMVGQADPQASYYSSDPYAQSAEAQRRYPLSRSQVPGTSGAPPMTPSATPGGVNSGAGTGYPGVPNAYPSLSPPDAIRGFFGGLAGGPPQQASNQANQQNRMFNLARFGMNMLAPPRNPFANAQPYPRPGPQTLGMGYDPRLFATLPQMQFGGRPTGPTIVGERGPEIFTPDVPGTISPNPYMAQNPLMRALQLGHNIQRRRFGMPPIGRYP